MSDLKHYIELTPPPLGGMSETLQPDIHLKCPHCHGNGWYWSEQELSFEWYKKTCPHCHGTGVLSPTITIQWSPTH